MGPLEFALRLTLIDSWTITADSRRHRAAESDPTKGHRAADVSLTSISLATQQVKVQVGYLLTSGFTTVDDHVVAVLQTFLGGDFRDGEHAMADD